MSLWHDDSHGSATPKGLARRQLLAEAAGAILTEYGHEAVRHRAVAQEAGLPLAPRRTTSTRSPTSCERRSSTPARSTRRRWSSVAVHCPSARAARARLLMPSPGSLVGDWPMTRLVTRCELFVLAVRHPEFAEIVTQRHDQVSSVVAQVLAKSKRHHSPEQVHRGWWPSRTARCWSGSPRRPGSRIRPGASPTPSSRSSTSSPRPWSRSPPAATKLADVAKPEIANVLASRYASTELADIWSPRAKIAAERRLWIAGCGRRKNSASTFPTE